jgi:hypothetical protein
MHIPARPKIISIIRIISAHVFYGILLWRKLIRIKTKCLRSLVKNQSRSDEVTWKVNRDPAKKMTVRRVVIPKRLALSKGRRPTVIGCWA